MFVTVSIRSLFYTVICRIACDEHVKYCGERSKKSTKRAKSIHHYWTRTRVIKLASPSPP